MTQLERPEMNDQTQDGSKPSGPRHTRLLIALNDELLRQHPKAVFELGDDDLVIPSVVAKQTTYVKIDTSSLAEAVLSLAIAADPDLLASLQSMTALVVLKYGNLDPDVNVAVEAARAAISKATGAA